MESISQPQKDQVFGGRFTVLKQIGQGTFGTIFAGFDKQNNQNIAMKFESIQARYPQIQYESKVIKHMQGNEGFSTLYGTGTESEFNFMALDMLGPSLEDLFNYCNRKFSLKTVLILADQAIKRLECLHNNSIVHRDLKPDNFLIGGQGHVNTLYLIDFGLAKRYKNQRNQHMAQAKHRSLTGTARYASINAHYGLEQSRRDDMEALGYMIIYMLMGGLPWQNVRCKEKSKKYKKIMEAKLETNMEVLLNGYPREFIDYMEYVRNLEYEEKPDYKSLISRFKDLYHKSGFKEDFNYDWNVLQQKMLRQSKKEKSKDGQEGNKLKKQNTRRTKHAKGHESQRGQTSNPQTGDQEQMQLPNRLGNQRNRKVTAMFQNEDSSLMIPQKQSQEQSKNQNDNEESPDRQNSGEINFQQMKEYLIAQGFANEKFNNNDSMFANMISNNVSLFSSMNSPASAGLKRALPFGSLKVTVPQKNLGSILLSPLIIGKPRDEGLIRATQSPFKRDYSMVNNLENIKEEENDGKLGAKKEQALLRKKTFQIKVKKQELRLAEQINPSDFNMENRMKQSPISIKSRKRSNFHKKSSRNYSEWTLDKISDTDFDEFGTIEDLKKSLQDFLHHKDVSRDFDQRNFEYKSSFLGFNKGSIINM
eukprot:403376534